MVAKTCSFIGHRKLNVTDELVARISCEVENLLRLGVRRFLFGTRSRFNSLCHEIVSEFRDKYPDIVRVAYTTFHECATMEKDVERHERIMSEILKEEVHLFGYDEEQTPNTLRKSGKATYIERDRIMIDQSDLCVFYYDEDYRPERRDLSRRFVNNVRSSAQSGTELAYKYAIRKKKNVINLFQK